MTTERRWHCRGPQKGKEFKGTWKEGKTFGAKLVVDGVYHRRRGFDTERQAAAYYDAFVNHYLSGKDYRNQAYKNRVIGFDSAAADAALAADLANGFVSHGPAA